MLNVNRNSVFFKLGLLFSATFVVYFFVLPVIVLLGVFDEKFIDSIYTRKGLDLMSPRAAFYLIGGFVCFNLGYWFLRNENRLINLVASRQCEWRFPNILVGAVGLFVAGIFSKILGVLKGAHNHPHYWSPLIEDQLVNFFLFVNPLQILALILVFFGLLSARDVNDRRWGKIFAIVFVPMFITMVLASLLLGSKALTLGIVFPVLAMVAMRFSFWKSVFLVVCLFIFTTLVMVGKSIVETSLTQSNFDYDVARVSQTFFGRVNQSHIVTKIANIDEERLGSRVFLEFIEHLKPKTYRSNIIANGNEFAHEYGFINENDKVTGVGRTVVGGLFIAFGWWGIIVGMFFLGCIYSMISGFAATKVGFVFYVFTLFNMLVRIEQDLIFLIITLFFHLSIVLCVHFVIVKDGMLDWFCNRALVLWHTRG